MSPRLPSCRPADIERVLLKLGFVLDRQRGSHRIFVRSSDNRIVVLAWHSRDLKRGTLHGLIKRMGISAEEFAALL